MPFEPPIVSVPRSSRISDPRADGRTTNPQLTQVRHVLAPSDHPRIFPYLQSPLASRPGPGRPAWFVPSMRTCTRPWSIRGRRLPANTSPLLFPAAVHLAKRARIAWSRTPSLSFIEVTGRRWMDRDVAPPPAGEQAVAWTGMHAWRATAAAGRPASDRLHTQLCPPASVAVCPIPRPSRLSLKYACRTSRCFPCCTYGSDCSSSTLP
jgi:hypothetical protein